MQSPTLHSAIEQVLREAGTAATVDAVARAIAERRLYSLSKATPAVPVAMVEHRIRAHPELFDLAGAHRRH